LIIYNKNLKNNFITIEDNAGGMDFINFRKMFSLEENERKGKNEHGLGVKHASI
jgi:hypothetical protein